MNPTRRTARPLTLAGLLLVASVDQAHAVALWESFAGPPTMVPTSVVLDTLRHRLLAVGSNENAAQLMALTLGSSSWTPIPSWPWPSGPAVYDGARDRLLVVHWNGSGSEAWELPLTTLLWDQIPTAGDADAPADSGLSGLLIDPTGDQLIAIDNDVISTLNLSGSPAWARPSISGQPHASIKTTPAKTAGTVETTTNARRND